MPALNGSTAGTSNPSRGRISIAMKRSASVLIVSALVAVPLVAGARLHEAGDVDIRFQAKAIGLKINGTSDQGKAVEKDGKVTISVPTDSLKTGIGLRDDHLKGYLNAEKCTSITLTVDRSKLKFPDNDKEVESSASGEFTLNCQTKTKTFKYKAKRTGSDYHVQAMFDVDIKDHGVAVPEYKLVKVEKDVKVKAQMKLRDGK
jgi:polyisoprenoid-binding protein YceI